MSRTARIIIGLIVLVLIVVIAILVYIWVSGGSATPSAPLSAPTLSIPTQGPTLAPTLAPASTTASTAEATSAASTAISTAASTAAATAQATEAATSSAATAQASAAAASAGQLTVMNIVPDQSQVHFITHEVLRGSPNTVNGCTTEIAGQIGVDFSNPQSSQVGVIKIDARTFATDNELRNRAIRGQILQSSQDQYEFITFQPTKLDGLPSSVTMGQQFEIHIEGNLTIRDITKPVTFDTMITPDSKSEIKGTASATVQRSDYNLTIPNVPGVADVAQAVDLQLSFLANTAPAQQASSSTCPAST